jgi:PST family polysaccharide transporter
MDQHNKNIIIGSINWNFINTISQTILTFGVGVVLARILDPNDFGLFGLTIILLGILNLLFTGSISRFIIQKENLDAQDIESSLGISIFLSLVAYLIVWFISPLVASFFHYTILSELIRVYTISIFFISVSSILRGILIKKMNFKLLFYSDLIAIVFGYSIVGIILALNNFGVFSLIYATLIKELLSLITLYFFSKPGISFKINLAKIKHIFYYSGGVGLSNIFGYAANNADYVIIGKLLNTNALGLYTRAFTIMTLPLSKISMTLFDVIFSVFSNAKNDLQQIKNIYLKSIKLIALLSFPILSTIMIGSELIITGIYGEKWSGAIRVLQILCIAGFFRVITNSAGAVAKATGKVYAEAWRQLIFALILIIGALIGIKYGIEGVGFAVVISSLWFYLSMAHLALRILKLTWSEFLIAQIPGTMVFFIITLINLVTLSALNHFINQEMYILKLSLLLTISSTAFFILLKTLPVRLIGDDGRNLIALYFGKLKTLSKRGIEYVDSF